MATTTPATRAANSVICTHADRRRRLASTLLMVTHLVETVAGPASGVGENLSHDRGRGLPVAALHELTPSDVASASDFGARPAARSSRPPWWRVTQSPRQCHLRK